MKKFFKYPSIEQFRQTVKDIKYNGGDKQVVFNKTIKIHGSNAAIVLDTESGDVYAQSRNKIITVGDDNLGFAKYVEKNKEELEVIITGHIERYLKFGAAPSQVVVYGEWCGEGIQKGVAVSQLPKMFVVFGVKIIQNNDSDCSFFECDNTKIKENFNLQNLGLYNVHMFYSEDVLLDFTNPIELQETLLIDVKSVEDVCPVGKYFGVDGIGDGFVYTSVCGEYKFKVKGEKHTVSKTKVMTVEELEVMKEVEHFVASTVTDVRLSQGIEYLNEMGLTVENKNMGEYIKWIVSDLSKEEGDLVESLGLNQKTVNKQVSKVARGYFQKQM